MAGHISYPRTIAAENAWLNYRHAVDLANCGATDASISILQKIINDLSAPTHLKELATQLLRTLLANTGNFSSKKSLTENILEVSAGQPVAATTKICSERMKKLLQEDVEKALKSSDPDKALEGQVGKMVINDLESFNKKIGLHGSVGEIDVETSSAIIEVTSKQAGKLSQIKKLMKNPSMNPLKKHVILYAPNYKETPAKDITETGAIIVRSEQELLQLLSKL